jgi:hypothetical protein
MNHRSPKAAAGFAIGLLLAATIAASNVRGETVPEGEVTSIQSLAGQVAVGDIVFIRVNAKPFREVAAATVSWTNHVGIVVDTSGKEPLIGESTFPLSRATSLSRFIARSEGGRVAVLRLRGALTEDQQRRVRAAADSRAHILYDTGFDLHSHREFCSRYVREVVEESTGIELGEVETFGTLLKAHPDADLGFWRLWFFGFIPWDRETVTPASLLHSRQLEVVFDGSAIHRPS